KESNYRNKYSKYLVIIGSDNNDGDDLLCVR
ncbi:unnamed protein product, partial [Rotaria sp. Silwood2]